MMTTYQASDIGYQPIDHTGEDNETHRWHLPSVLSFAFSFALSSVISRQLRCWMGFIALVASGIFSVNAQTSRAIPSISQSLSEPSQGVKAGANVKVSISVRDSTIKFVMLELARQARLRLVYDNTAPLSDKRISISIKDTPVLDAMARVLQGTGLVAKVAPDGETIAIGTPSDSTPRSRPAESHGRVNGRVVDSATGAGVRGATVTIQGTNLSVMTAESGRFVFYDVPIGQQALSVRMFGYRNAIKAVSVTADNPTTVTLAIAGVPTALADVVTTVTGQQRRIEMGNSIAVVNVDSIVRATGVKNLTDVLDGGRVPGLVVSRASGAPGAPAKIRIRGISSINATTDPIIFVDGVRTYSNQTTSNADAEYSVLDRIDVETIETIEVLKGPSASAMYGSDAANGVILITTKKGQPGTTRWAMSTKQQRTTQPGMIPDLYYREGTPLTGGRPLHCLLSDRCVNDTLYVFNPLANSRTSVLGAGYTQGYNVNVSGGSTAIRYFLSVSASSDRGLLKLPDADAEYLESQRGQPVPRWLRHPQSNTAKGLSANIGMQVTPQLTIDLVSSLNYNTRSTTPLSQAIGIYQRATLGDTSVVTGSIFNYRQQETFDEASYRTAGTARWRVTNWLNLAGDIGRDVALRRTETLLRNGDCDSQIVDCYITAVGNKNGRYTRNDLTKALTSLNVRTNMDVPRRFGVHLMPYAGINYTYLNNSAFNIRALGLLPGGTSSSGADSIAGSELQNRDVTAGVYVGTRLGVFDRIYTSFGTRVDASNALGSRVRPTYPKLDLSYPLSEESWFPRDLISQLRVRLAYGHAARQPELGQQLRTYQNVLGVVDGVSVPILLLATAGNPDLRPERSKELEWGIDMTTWNDRAVLSLTQYQKRTADAFTTLSLPRSIGTGASIGYTTTISGVSPASMLGKGFVTNLGAVKNSGLELELSVRPIENSFVNWSVSSGITRNRSVITSLSPTMDQNVLFLKSSFRDVFVGQRNVVGYPVNGWWIRPVVSYGDQNQNGVLEDSEIVRSDSAVFLGGTQPKFSTTFGTQLAFLNGRIQINANAEYTGGMAQINEGALENLVGDRLTGAGTDSYGSYGVGKTLRAINDPSTSIAEQVAVLSGYAFSRSVSTTRLTSLAVAVIAPQRLARKFRAQEMRVSLQGQNVGLWTNYSGIDPNVNNSIVGNSSIDGGNLPMPRTWGIDVSLRF